MLNRNTNDEIQFIYFDVGGVAILDFSKTNKWEEMMSDLAVPEEQFALFKRTCKSFAPKLHVGAMTIEEEIETLTREFSLELPTDYDMLEDFVSRFERNPSLCTIIQALSKTHKIGLLTNMYAGMLDSISAHGLLPRVAWDVVVDSVAVGLQKPDDAIFALAEQKAGVSGERILYVDNSEDNLNAAAARGWQTFLYDPADTFSSNATLKGVLGM